MDEFAQRLKRLRQEKGLSQTELGVLAKIHYTHISKYERGESSPSMETLILLADVLNVTLDYLVKGNQTDAVVADFCDKELLKMFIQTENLPASEKELVTRFLGAFLKNKKFEELIVTG